MKERPGGQMFVLSVGPTFDAARVAYAEDLRRWEPSIEAVADLFLRMTTRRAEVAATVHFVFKQLSDRKGSVPTDKEVFAEVMRWKQRRRPAPSEGEVLEMIRALTIVGWVEVKLTEFSADSSDADIAVEA
jgi:hypothetical protein